MDTMNTLVIVAMRAVDDSLSRLDDEFPNDKTYAGMCNVACQYMKEYIATTYWANVDEPIKVQFVHGELIKSPMVKSEDWHYEHTWLKLSLRDKWLYVDPTAKQWKVVFPNIPDVYISVVPPRWFIPDAISSLRLPPVKALNNIRMFDKTINMDVGAYDWFVDNVYGKVSDWIGTNLHIRKYKTGRNEQ